MQLPGRLRCTTLGDVFGALHRARATGALELTEHAGASAGRSHLVHFDSGLVWAIDSAFSCSLLGELLRRQGFLDSRAATLMETRLRFARGPIGKLLVDERLVSPAVVRAALREQMKQRLERLFALEDARICFHVPRPRGAAERPVPLVPSEFLHGRARARVRAGKSERASQLTPQKRRALSILGLDSAADADTVRRRFRTLAAELHPDRFPFASGVERAANMRRFAELSAAYHAIV